MALKLYIYCMSARTIQLDEETYARLAAQSQRDGKSIEELVRELAAHRWPPESSNDNFGDLQIEDLLTRERSARSQVRGFSASDNVPRERLHRR